MPVRITVNGVPIMVSRKPSPWYAKQQREYDPLARPRAPAGWSKERERALKEAEIITFHGIPDVDNDPLLQ